MKIAVIGSHGVGKTTACHIAAAQIKKAFPEKSIIIIPELVREVSHIFPINSPQFTEYCILEKRKRILEASLHYDVIISDRSYIDYCIYSEFFDGGLDYYLNEYVQNMHNWNHVIFIRPNDNNITEDGFRMTNIKERNEVDVKFKEFYDYNIIGSKQILKTSEINDYDFAQLAKQFFKQEV